MNRRELLKRSAAAGFIAAVPFSLATKRRMGSYPRDLLRAFIPLEGLGLMEKIGGDEGFVSITDSGRRFRNLLLIKRRNAVRNATLSK
jgi:hypothetical protein